MPSLKRGDKLRNAATQEALRSNMRYRHGAIITKGGKILGQGHNHVRTGFSGPLNAHAAVELPVDNDTAADHEDEQAWPNHPCCHAGSQPQSYFSMHAEMHAITTALRGAKPHIPRSSLVVDPVDMACAKLKVMSLAMQDGSRFGDASSMSTGKRAMDIKKTKCDRALVEGAKREQQRVAFAPESQWCLKPRYQERTEEKPSLTQRWTQWCGPWMWALGR